MIPNRPDTLRSLGEFSFDSFYDASEVERYDALFGLSVLCAWRWQ